MNESDTRQTTRTAVRVLHDRNTGELMISPTHEGGKRSIGRVERIEFEGHASARVDREMAIFRFPEPRKVTVKHPNSIEGNGVPVAYIEE